MLANPAIKLGKKTTVQYRFISKLRRNRSLQVGIAMVLLIILLVLLGPVISPYDPNQQNLSQAFAQPSTAHWFGTDNFGRDLFTRILIAGRFNLQFAFLATLISLSSGLVLGAMAGYFGGWFDSTLMRLLDVLIAFPGLVLVIAIISVLGTGAINMYISVALIGWIPYARVVRGEVLVEKRKEYVSAARVMGARSSRMILKHLLPNVFSAALVYAASDAVGFLMFAAGLGFLGLGIQPPNAEWGTMIAEGRTFILYNANLTLFPGLAILVTGISFSQVAEGLADFLRPG